MVTAIYIWILLGTEKEIKIHVYEWMVTNQWGWKSWMSFYLAEKQI